MSLRVTGASVSLYGEKNSLAASNCSEGARENGNNAMRRETEKERTGCLSVNYSGRSCSLVNCLKVLRLPRRFLIAG